MSNPCPHDRYAMYDDGEPIVFLVSRTGRRTDKPIAALFRLCLTCHALFLVPDKDEVRAWDPPKKPQRQGKQKP